MSATASDPTRLRYLSSDHLEAPVPCDHVDVWNRDDESIGALDGVIIDTATRRLRYLVVDTCELFGHYRFLLPFRGVQVDTEHQALRVDVGGDPRAECEPFDPGAFAAFA